MVAVLFEADQDLIDLHRAIVALEDFHDGRGERAGGRAGAGLTRQGRGTIGGFLAGARRTATTAGNHCFPGRQHHGWLRELQGRADEFMELDTQALDFLGDLIALLEDLAVLDGHWKSLKWWDSPQIAPIFPAGKTELRSGDYSNQGEGDRISRIGVYI